MDGVREALYQKLKGDPQLMSLLNADGDTVFHNSKDTGKLGGTYIVINAADPNRPTYTLSDTAFEESIWQIKVVSTALSASLAESARNRVKELLQDSELIVDGQAASYVRRETDVSPYKENIGNTRIWHVASTYRIMHNQ